MNRSHDARVAELIKANDEQVLRRRILNRALSILQDQIGPDQVKAAIAQAHIDYEVEQ